MDAYGPAGQSQGDAFGGAGPYGQTNVNTAAAVNAAAALIAAGRGAVSSATSAVLPTEEITTLWVGSLPVGTQEAELVRVFSQYGMVLACVVHSKPSPQGSLSGFVRYSTRQEGELAMSYCNAGATQINNMPIVAKWAKGNSRIGMGVGGHASAGPVAMMPGMALLSSLPSASPVTPLPGMQLLTAVAASTQAPLPPPPLISQQRLTPRLQTLSVFGLPSGISNEELKAGFEWTGFPCIAQVDGNNVGFVKFATPEIAEAIIARTGGAPFGLKGAAAVLSWPQSDMAGDVNAVAP